MANRLKLDRAKVYNQRWRAKQTKIKAFAKQLDQGVVALEKLPPCADCIALNVRLQPYRHDCCHTPERHQLTQELGLVRMQLQQVDH